MLNSAASLSSKLAHRYHQTINIAIYNGRSVTSEDLDADALHELGFHPKYKEAYRWQPEDDTALLAAVSDIASGKLVVHVQDPCYYISHYIFYGKISTLNVTERVDMLLLQKNAKAPVKATLKKRQKAKTASEN